MRIVRILTDLPGKGSAEFTRGFGIISAPASRQGNHMARKSDDHLSATRSFKFNTRLKPLFAREDLPERWLDSPIEEFIAAHNFEKPVEEGTTPKLLVVS